MTINNKISLKGILILTLFSSLLLGCASAGIKTKYGVKTNDIFTAFSTGEARLTCGFSCAGAWGLSRNTQKEFHKNGLWNELAFEVSTIGFASDQSYYYMGRSAEGLGHQEAARTYYKLALSEVRRCNRLSNNCDGLNFPDDVNIRLSQLNAKAYEKVDMQDKLKKEVESTKQKALIEVEVEQPINVITENKIKETVALVDNNSKKIDVEKITKSNSVKSENRSALALNDTINSTSADTPEQSIASKKSKSSGPFGLKWGLSESQVRSMGVSLVKYPGNSENNLSLYLSRSLPKNISFGESYLLLFYPNLGLQKVAVYSKKIKNDTTGSKGKELYNDIKTQLTSRYSEPSLGQQISGLKLYKDNDEFYECLKYRGCAYWYSVWDSPNAISLELDGVSRGTGQITLTYEGPLWDKIINKEKMQSTKKDANAL